MMNRQKALLSINLALAGVCLISAATLSEAAPRRDEVRILGVKRIEAAGPGQVGLEPAKMVKFLRERADNARLTFAVGWDAGSGVEVGTLVTFEYRQAGGEAVKFLSHKTETPLQGRQESFFVLPEGGNVEAWRVRVVYRGRRLAERKSELWR